MATKDPLWESYKKCVASVKKKRRASLRSPALEKAEIRKNAQSDPLRLPSTAPAPLPDTSLERKREKSLRTGKLDIEAKLDLHGKTQIEAFEALSCFMVRMVKSGKRHILIVTGKGREGEGILHRSLKSWLSQTPTAPKILAVRPAAPKHGGEGAFYVVLRKK